MVLYQGAMDYYIIKNNGKNVIILLDNHALEEYCKYTAQNIDKLFKNFLDKDDATIVLEEVVGNVNYTSIFNSKHLTIFEEFYNKYRNNENVISIDIRLLLKKDRNLDVFFGISTTNDNTLKNIKIIIDETCKLYPKFNEQYQILFSQYKKTQNSLDSELLNLHYPFKIMPYDENNNVLMCGIMELYTMAYVLNSDKKNVILYLGAAHGAVICKLLMSYYGYQMKRNNNLSLNSRDEIYYNDFERLGSMCIDFIEV